MNMRHRTRYGTFLNTDVWRFVSQFHAASASLACVWQTWRRSFWRALSSRLGFSALSFFLSNPIKHFLVHDDADDKVPSCQRNTHTQTLSVSESSSSSTVRSYHWYAFAVVRHSPEIDAFAFDSSRGKVVRSFVPSRLEPFDLSST